MQGKIAEYTASSSAGLSTLTSLRRVDGRARKARADFYRFTRSRAENRGVLVLRTLLSLSLLSGRRFIQNPIHETVGGYVVKCIRLS